MYNVLCIMYHILLYLICDFIYGILLFVTFQTRFGGSVYQPGARSSLRPPLSWSMSAEKSPIEFSSDEDNDVCFYIHKSIFSLLHLLFIIIDFV